MSKPIKDIPMAHIMAFNMVSAPAYVGVAAGQIIDCTLDDEPDMEVIILAKDEATLKRYHKFVGIGLDTTKVQKVALASTRTLRIHPYGSVTSATPQSPPDDEL